MLLDYIITPECSLAVIPKMCNLDKLSIKKSTVSNLRIFVCVWANDSNDFQLGQKWPLYEINHFNCMQTAKPWTIWLIRRRNNHEYVPAKSRARHASSGNEQCIESKFEYWGIAFPPDQFDQWKIIYMGCNYILHYCRPITLLAKKVVTPHWRQQHQCGSNFCVSTWLKLA